MSFSTKALYHWSPVGRRESIELNGLVPRVFTSVVSHTRQPVLYFSVDAATAWELSGGSFNNSMTWDLWQIRLSKKDETHIVPCWGGKVTEVCIANSIPSARLQRVAGRMA